MPQAHLDPAFLSQAGEWHVEGSRILPGDGH